MKKLWNVLCMRMHELRFSSKKNSNYFKHALENYKKILVVGSPGAGKTTFSKLLAKKLNIPVRHIDDIYWQANWLRTDHDVMLQQLEMVCKEQQWILDGNHLKTLEKRLKYADVIILLDYSVNLCFTRFIKRSVKRYLGINDNLPINIEQSPCLSKKISIPWHILKLILGFKFLARPQLLRMAAENNVPIVYIKSRSDVKHLLNL